MTQNQSLAQPSDFKGFKAIDFLFTVGYNGIDSANSPVVHKILVNQGLVQLIHFARDFGIDVLSLP